jgi:dephospho-CoA kinase
MRVGLTGGIGSGKSVAAEALARLGALVIDTDVLAREAVAPGGDAFMQIAREWPAVVRSGAVDRAALARIVFEDPAARTRLNEIVHPHVRRLALEREAGAAPGQLIVHVVPLLFETGYADLVDRSIVVIAPDSERLARVQARDGVDEASVRARMAAQLLPEEARRRADYTIENDGDLSHLRTAVRAVYENLTSARSQDV